MDRVGLSTVILFLSTFFREGVIDLGFGVYFCLIQIYTVSTTTKYIYIY